MSKNTGEISNQRKQATPRKNKDKHTMSKNTGKISNQRKKSKHKTTQDKHKITKKHRENSNQRKSQHMHNRNAVIMLILDVPSSAPVLLVASFVLPLPFALVLYAWPFVYIVLFRI